MQLLKHLWLMIICVIALLACNSGSNTTSSSSPYQPTTITLPSGTTITIPSTNLYVPHDQTLQVPITIVGGNLASGESLMISATLTRQSQAVKTSNALQESSDLPLISISPTVISVSPHLTSTVYLNIDDSTGAVGSYSISMTVKDPSNETIIIVPKGPQMFILEHTCSTSDLQSCSKQNRCYAYVNPAIASVNQDGHTQYSAMAMMPDSPNNCYANITQQTAWSSTIENVATINSSGQITPINLGNTIITAGSNTYNINYLWSESSELSVVPAVPFPGGYGSLSVTDLSDITYSCSNGLNKPIYMMVNNATGILGQTVSGYANLNGYVVHVSDVDIPIVVGNTGYGEVRLYTAGHPFSLNVRACQDYTDFPMTLSYGGTINGYKYPNTVVYIKVID
ncbi:MAG: hypothetical protein KAZ94_03855 [Burkholderiales bacterium]|nr:hypothetical protein [uncultured bacterium]MBP7847243.1 hypothetical protein [Burkholderiales bacterium]MBP9769224.1 hypothetical protein [Burkholderiales bacterium]